MAKELNFDELDKAVSNYMKKPSEPAPSEPKAAPAAPAPVATTPAPMAEKPAIPPPAPAKAVTPPAAKPVADSTLRVQLRSRGSITPRSTSAGGSTFHDIMPAHRRSTVVPTKQIKPLSDVAPPSSAPATPVTPMPPAKPSLPEEKTPEPLKVPDVVAPTAPAPPPADVTLPDPQESELVKVELEKPVEVPAGSSESKLEAESSPEGPKILGANESEESKPAAMEPEPETPVEPAEEEHDDHVIPPASTDDLEPAAEAGQLLKPEPPALSDALLEDLRRESEASGAPDSEQPQPPAADKSEAPVSPKPESNEPKSEPSKTSNLLAATPLELEDGKGEAPGILNTGELHQTATPVETAHMLDAGSDDEQTMKVFDTKEYHTPIAGHETTPHKSKKWELLIVILVILIVAAAAFVAYMMAFGSSS